MKSEDSNRGIAPPPMPWRTAGVSPEFRGGRGNERTSTWIWVLVAGGVAILLIGLAAAANAAFKGFLRSGAEATTLVEQLHHRMAARDWDGIYADASPDYRAAVTPDKSRALFTGIDRKLGVPVSTTQSGMQVNADTSGSYLRAAFQTKFSANASGTETVLWKKVGGQYRLQRYNINSDELMER